jgi:DNA-directed RNA polymerase specialized sigma24 family protein
MVDQDGLKSWVLRVAANVAIDQVRGRKHRRIPLSGASTGPGEPNNECPTKFISLGTDPAVASVIVTLPAQVELLAVGPDTTSQI